jgi:hypothetical protein
MSTLNSTPQPYRADNPVRNSFESELWDDMANGVFVTNMDTLIVPMPVAGRVEVVAQADVAGATIPICGWYDLPVGNNTLTLTASGVMSNIVFMARRGRVK